MRHKIKDIGEKRKEKRKGGRVGKGKEKRQKSLGKGEMEKRNGGKKKVEKRLGARGKG